MVKKEMSARKEKEDPKVYKELPVSRVLKVQRALKGLVEKPVLLALLEKRVNSECLDSRVILGPLEKRVIKALPDDQEPPETKAIECVIFDNILRYLFVYLYFL